MKRLLLFCCCLWSGVAVAQQNQETNFKNNLFLELLGNGGYASLNYERRIFQQQKVSLYPFIGISTFRVKDFTGYVNPDLILPIGLRMYYGTGRHQLVLGLGQTLSSTVRLATESFKPERSYGLSANLMLGYRTHFKRINLQLAYTPILERYDRYIHWLGVAVGYRF